jgi:subtilase family serine protease
MKTTLWIGYASCSLILSFTLYSQVQTDASRSVAIVAGHIPSPVRDGRARLTGHYDPNRVLRLVVGLQPPYMAEEEQFLRDLQTKGSRQFHRFLTADEWNSRFAPSAQDEQAVVDWAQSQKMKITHRYPNRLVVDLEGPADTIERAISVTMNTYQLGAATFFSNDRNPAVPIHLAGIVHSIGGLNNLGLLHPASPIMKEPSLPDYLPGPVVTRGLSGKGKGDRAKLTAFTAKVHTRSSNVVANITGRAYDPTDIYSSEAYDYEALNNLGHCCNPLGNPGSSPRETSIAIATAGAFDSNDLLGFHNAYPYLAYNVQPIDIDGTAACCSAETTQDVEWALATANSFGSYIDTAKIWVYEGANSATSTFTDIYNQMLIDSYARVLSVSWGCAELYCYDANTMDTDHAIFNQMSGQGWTLVAAAGNGGATANCALDSVMYPASDPNVVAAGGTTLLLNPDGTYNSEVAWSGGPYGCSSGDGGGGSGVSAYFPRADWGQVVDNSNRELPDLSLNADWVNAPQNIYFQGALRPSGGTSIVAPELAGFFAQADAYLLFINPEGCYNVSPVGGNPCPPIGDPHVFLNGDVRSGVITHYPFYDVTSGCDNNDITASNGLGYYCAGPGYDIPTGWGSANMLQLAWDINFDLYEFSGVPPAVTFAGPATGIWYNTGQTVSWTVFEPYDDGNPYFKQAGIAGFSRAWDSDPGDPYSEPTPGSGNSFYDGPQFPNATSDSVGLSSAGQGCHTVNVRGWDNSGWSTGDQSYGPLCYDTIGPQTTPALKGRKIGKAFVTPVRITLAASDMGSGVAGTVYQIDGGSVNTYTAPFTESAPGSHIVTFHSSDNAGNVEGTESVRFAIRQGRRTH